MSTDMIDATFFLCLRMGGRTWPKLDARLAKKKPSLAPGEVSVELKINVPRVLFQRPTLRATINVPEAQAGSAVIDATVMENIAQTLSDQLGIKVEVGLS